MDFNIEVNSDHYSLYQNGVDFLTATERCLGMDENGVISIIDGKKLNTLPAPAVVNATFACEMFFKSLIMKSGNIYPTDRHGHDLKYLFDMLPASMKENMIRYCLTDVTDAEKRFTEFLSAHSKDFIDVRYYATKDGWHRISPFTVYSYTYNIRSITKYLLDNWTEGHEN